MAEQTFTALVRDLTFRPERSRPVYRNKHTGASTVVVDLAINDHGGFQGGCRQFVVITNEPPRPGPPAPPAPMRRTHGPRGANVHALWSFLQHWEPTGDRVPWTEEPREDPVKPWRDRALKAEGDLAAIRNALGVAAA